MDHVEVLLRQPVREAAMEIAAVNTDTVEVPPPTVVLDVKRALAPVLKRLMRGAWNRAQKRL